MKKIINYIMVMTGILVTVSCSDSFLDYTPKGTLNGDMLNNTQYLDGMVTAAYASLGNDDWGYAFSHMWIWGSVRSDDAFKGGGSVSDQGGIHTAETFVNITTSDSKPNLVWTACYEGIGRANDALRRIDLATEEDYPKKVQREAECRFIRGHFHFLLKIIFKNPPYIDELVATADTKDVPNNIYTNDELWDKIAEDFEFAANNLPETQEEIGRASSVAAKAYLAKVRLYQAYEQDDMHNVININKSRLQEVVDLCDEVILTGKHSLSKDFADNFLVETENGPESIFAIQFSYNDGTPYGRLFKAAGLNYSMAPECGCCDFHNPSQTLVNAFKTDADGLPMFDTYNDEIMRFYEDFWTNSVDPRFDHTIGATGHPFKYRPDWVYQDNWRRNPQIYGYYSSMKEVVAYDDPSFTKYGAFMGSALNQDILRYDDLLLWKAEALIELDRAAEALPIINQIRQRAANSTGRLVKEDGTPTSNYKCNTYEDGVNCVWTQEFARQALRWERRLEFAMEGSRFFDLVRWGIAAETLNNYFEIESSRFSFLLGAFFTKNRDEYLPIPYVQITRTDFLYEQNYGW